MNISVQAVSAQAPTAAVAGHANSLHQQIGQIEAQIVQLSARLQELYKSGLPQKETEVQARLLQARIQALQARMAELMREAAERAARSEAEADGAAHAQPSSSASAGEDGALPAGVLAVA